MDCIDVFAGAGGAALGLQNAGFNVVLAMEMNPFAALSYTANFPAAKVCIKNLFLYSIQEACREFGFGPDFHGLVWLSPPCQGFSSAGEKQGESDQRNALAFKAVEAGEYMPEAWIVVENVTGLTAGNAQPIYDELLANLGKQRGVVDWELRAAEWGLPQERNRVFIIAAPFGWGGKLPTMPIPALELGPRSLGETILRGFRDLDPDFFELTETERLIYSEIPDGGNWQDSDLGRQYSKIRGRRGADGNFLARLSASQPCPCITASSPRASDYRCEFVHPTGLRHLSVGEAKSLMGFPEAFLLAGPIDVRWRQNGNAVMPFMSAMIGKAILAAERQFSIS